MKKRLVSLMLCAVMGITMLAGCASGSGDSGEDKGSSGSEETVSYTHLGTGFFHLCPPATSKEICLRVQLAAAGRV